MTDGFFVAFEGGDGGGKSTQEAMLAKSLVAEGHSVLRTREPGGTEAAEAMRAIVLDPQFDTLDDRAEALLYAASRADHAANVIRPALARGEIVICDRFIDSSVAYQGIGRGLGAEAIRELSLWATGGLVPHLTIVLDVDPSVGLTRVGKPDRLESLPASFHAQVRTAYLDLAERDPERYLVLDASRTIPDLADAILARVHEGLTRRTS